MANSQDNIWKLLGGIALIVLFCATAPQFYKWLAGGIPVVQPPTETTPEQAPLDSFSDFTKSNRYEPHFVPQALGTLSPSPMEIPQISSITNDSPVEPEASNSTAEKEIP